MPKQARIARPGEAPRTGGADPAPLLGRGSSLTKVPPDHVVVVQGAPCDAIFYIHSGVVKASVVSESGREAVLLMLARGNFFGEGALRDDARRVATVTSMTKCTLERIEGWAAREALDQEPKFAKQLTDNLLRRNFRFLEDLVDQHFHSTEKRLARALLRLAPADGGETEMPQIRQTMLAEMIGTTRSRVNFFMNKFRRLGLIEYDGKLVVHDRLADILHSD